MTSIQKKTASRKPRKRAAPPKYDPGSTEELKSLVEAQIKIEEAAEGAQGLFANIADQGVDKLRRSAREWGMKLKATEEGQDTSSALLEKEKLQLFDETIQFCNEELSSIEAFKQTDTARLDRLIREFDETFLPKIDAARCRMPWKPDGCYVLDNREEDFVWRDLENLSSSDRAGDRVVKPTPTEKWEMPEIDEALFAMTGSGPVGGIARKIMAESEKRCRDRYQARAAALKKKEMGMAARESEVTKREGKIEQAEKNEQRGDLEAFSLKSPTSSFFNVGSSSSV